MRQRGTQPPCPAPSTSPWLHPWKVPRLKLGDDLGRHFIVKRIAVPAARRFTLAHSTALARLTHGILLAPPQTRLASPWSVGGRHQRHSGRDHRAGLHLWPQRVEEPGRRPGLQPGRARQRARRPPALRGEGHTNAAAQQRGVSSETSDLWTKDRHPQGRNADMRSGGASSDLEPGHGRRAATGRMA
jgi:hypothetical protein